MEHTVFTIVANGGCYELLSHELGGDVHQWSRLGPRPHRHLPPAERGNPCEHGEDECGITGGHAAAAANHGRGSGEASGRDGLEERGGEEVGFGS